MQSGLRARWPDCPVPMWQRRGHGADRAGSQNYVSTGGLGMCGSCGCGSSAVITLLPERTVPAWMGGQGRLSRRAARVHHHAHGNLLVADFDHEHDPADFEHSHEHDHEHGHDHVHVVGLSEPGRTVELQQKVLAKNDDLAERNREWLRERGILAINLMSSPGSGKTTLLERTTRELAGKVRLSVIEG